MRERSSVPIWKKFIFESPVFLGLFFVLPVLFVLSRFVGVFRIIPFNITLLLVNFVALLLIIALRFIWNLKRLRRDLRYDAASRPGSDGETIPRPVGQIRKKLAEAGFRFSAEGEYGEKRNPALLGATVFFGGLLLALLVGTLDYARQYSNVVLLSVGNPMQQGDSGYLLGRGFIASTSDMPQLQVKKQILPDKEWRHGATEIVLLNKNKVELARKTITWGGEPLKYGGFEYHMGRFLYDAGLTIVTKSGYLEFANYIRLQPNPKLEAPYTHATAFKGEADKKRGIWKAMYDPRRKALRLTLKDKDATLADGEIIFQKDIKKEIGGFVVEMNGMGNWSELHVVRSRHMFLVIFGAVIALLGGLSMLFFRPQRVWLEEAPEGSRVWAVGEETKRLMRDEG